MADRCDPRYQTASQIAQANRKFMVGSPAVFMMRLCRPTSANTLAGRTAPTDSTMMQAVYRTQAEMATAKLWPREKKMQAKTTWKR